VIFATENSNKFPKTGIWKEKSVEDHTSKYSNPIEMDI
jgi:hypothetical protein